MYPIETKELFRNNRKRTSLHPVLSDNEQAGCIMIVFFSHIYLNVGPKQLNDWAESLYQIYLEGHN